MEQSFNCGDISCQFVPQAQIEAELIPSLRRKFRRNFQVNKRGIGNFSKVIYTHT